MGLFWRLENALLSVLQQVWVLQDGQPTAVAVEPGATDGRMTEVRSSALQPGMAVIVVQAREAKR